MLCRVTSTTQPLDVKPVAFIVSAPMMCVKLFLLEACLTPFRPVKSSIRKRSANCDARLKLVRVASIAIFPSCIEQRFEFYAILFLTYSSRCYVLLFRLAARFSKFFRIACTPFFAALDILFSVLDVILARPISLMLSPVFQTPSVRWIHVV